ncbi:Serine/threonine-protein kinase/endoribonuclease IRE1 [Smittium culicis]|uniref:non-specific serine/threonine protein kinase n=1 Tax=Smittium culicis TaxID=133412 RepID=A0A1R1YAV6_9FUNG|nr:Serine/threonine-protein kinase/endoribonuclease IRE1 [Smittium culicis]
MRLNTTIPLARFLSFLLIITILFIFSKAKHNPLQNINSNPIKYKSGNRKQVLHVDTRNSKNKVVTVDGTIHGLCRSTGRILWSQKNIFSTNKINPWDGHIIYARSDKYSDLGAPETSDDNNQYHSTDNIPLNFGDELEFYENKDDKWTFNDGFEWINDSEAKKCIKTEWINNICKRRKLSSKNYPKAGPKDRASAWFIAEPSESGRLYMFDTEKKLLKLPLTIQDLVTFSPVKSLDKLFFGNKLTRFLNIDTFSGNITSIIDVDSLGFNSNPSYKKSSYVDQRNSFQISETSFKVKIYSDSSEDTDFSSSFDPKSDTVSLEWDLGYKKIETTRTNSKFDLSMAMAEILINSETTPGSKSINVGHQTKIAITADGHVTLLRASDGLPLWITSLNSTATTIFDIFNVTQNNASLNKKRASKIKFDSPNGHSETSQDWKLMIQKRELSPAKQQERLYIQNKIINMVETNGVILIPDPLNNFDKIYLNFKGINNGTPTFYNYNPLDLNSISTPSGLIPLLEWLRDGLWENNVSNNKSNSDQNNGNYDSNFEYNRYNDSPKNGAPGFDKDEYNENTFQHAHVGKLNDSLYALSSELFPIISKSFLEKLVRGVTSSFRSTDVSLPRKFNFDFIDFKTESSSASTSNELSIYYGENIYDGSTTTCSCKKDSDYPMCLIGLHRYSSSDVSLLQKSPLEKQYINYYLGISDSNDSYESNFYKKKLLNDIFDPPNASNLLNTPIQNNNPSRDYIKPGTYPKNNYYENVGPDRPNGPIINSPFLHSSNNPKQIHLKDDTTVTHANSTLAHLDQVSKNEKILEISTKQNHSFIFKIIKYLKLIYSIISLFAYMALLVASTIFTAHIPLGLIKIQDPELELELDPKPLNAEDSSTAELSVYYRALPGRYLDKPEIFNSIIFTFNRNFIKNKVPNIFGANNLESILPSTDINLNTDEITNNLYTDTNEPQKEPDNLENTSPEKTNVSEINSPDDESALDSIASQVSDSVNTMPDQDKVTLNKEVENLPSENLLNLQAINSNKTAKVSSENDSSSKPSETSIITNNECIDESSAFGIPQISINNSETDQGEENTKNANAESSIDESSQVSTKTQEPPNQMRNTFNSLELSDEVVGYGSHGTVVYLGSFEGRPVAVKRLLLDFYSSATLEVRILQEADTHANVIRYFCSEMSKNFLFIALELCAGSLYDAINYQNLDFFSKRQSRDNSKSAYDLLSKISPKRVLYQLAMGLHHLHQMKLVHRDIKPQNILLALPVNHIKNMKSRSAYKNTNGFNNGAQASPADPKIDPGPKFFNPFSDLDIENISGEPRVVISDFGLSRVLQGEESSFFNTIQFKSPGNNNGNPVLHGAGGTIGWRAPECFEDNVPAKSIYYNISPKNSAVDSQNSKISPNFQNSSDSTCQKNSSGTTVISDLSIDEVSPYTSRGAAVNLKDYNEKTIPISEDISAGNSYELGPHNENQAENLYSNDSYGLSGSLSTENICNNALGRKMTRKMDIFSLGCVYYYFLTQGNHPFGDRYSREQNILDNKFDLSLLEEMSFINTTYQSSYNNRFGERGSSGVDRSTTVIESSIEARDLIAHMIQRNPKFRPSTTSILVHPYFWSASKRLLFIQDVSDKLESHAKFLKAVTTVPAKNNENSANKNESTKGNNKKKQKGQNPNKKANLTPNTKNFQNKNNCSNSDNFEDTEKEEPEEVKRAKLILDEFEMHSEYVLETKTDAEAGAGWSRVGPLGWDKKLDRHLRNDLGSFRKYNFYKLRDLLRVIRNKKHHYQDLDIDLQNSLGPVPEGFCRYFESRFPNLLLHCYYFVLENDSIRNDSLFSQYFSVPS